MAIVVILDTLAEHVHLVQAEQEWMLDKTSMPISLTKNTKVPLKSHIIMSHAGIAVTLFWTRDIMLA